VNGTSQEKKRERDMQRNINGSRMNMGPSTGSRASDAQLSRNLAQSLKDKNSTRMTCSASYPRVVWWGKFRKTPSCEYHTIKAQNQQALQCCCPGGRVGKRGGGAGREQKLGQGEELDNFYR